MAEFEVRGSGLSGVEGQLDSISGKLETARMEIQSIRNGLSFKIAASAGIKSRLKNIEEKVAKEKRGSRNMRNGFSSSMLKYNTTEKRITGRGNINTSLKSIIECQFRFDKDSMDQLFERCSRANDFFEKCFNLSKLKGAAGGLLLSPVKSLKEMREWIRNLPDNIINATTWKKEGHYEGKFWSAAVGGKYGSAGVSVLAASAYMSASTGLYTKTKDGDLLFNPHFDGKIGGSVTALHVDANGHWGNSMAGANASADVDVGKVSANAKASVGMFNDKGEFDPRLKAGIDAEAIAIEAKGKAGVTILGTEAKVSGSLNVGVGAHADVGYNNGVLKFDVGASLGIGGSVGFEVDVGGTVDAVKKASKSALKSVGKGINKIGKFFGL